jgi:3-phosphoshikimate 1-carboxyvinyltransferase
LSALLIAAALAPANTVTEIDIPLLNEKPYVEMTLSYLKAQSLYSDGDSLSEGVKAAITAAADFSHFRIRGGGAYMPMNGPVPGDFSSAAFPAAAAAISKGKVTLLGLDPGDTQGDKVFFDYLKQMGCDVNWESDRVTVSRTGPLKGGTFDLNATPDMLPVMAAVASFAEGETALVNAAHARIKETDRIAVMTAELRKLFSGNSRFRCTEKPDGLLVQGAGSSVGASAATGQAAEKPAPNSAIELDGHGDHRIVMALACAALGGTAPVTIATAEAADVTYPGFLELL